MLQIDHVYEFLYENLFKDFIFWHLPSGVVSENNDPTVDDISVFTPENFASIKIFFYDQEPLLTNLSENYIKMFKFPSGYDFDKLWQLNIEDKIPYGYKKFSYEEHLENVNDPVRSFKKFYILVTSEKSMLLEEFMKKYNLTGLYYFFHGFAALDWYRGYYSLNYQKIINKVYNYDYISFNRIINNDRSYRIYFVSLLKERNLFKNGQISFNVTNNNDDDWRNETSDPNSKLSEKAKQHAENYLVNINKLIVDSPELSGSASANIPRTISGWWPNGDQPNVDAFWHIVTETVFYYDKLHLTEKIFKPIVSKQPFMLLAAPGNLAYLKSYGFKTFDSVIDESYDTIQDNDARIEAVVDQLHWYCNLTPGEKADIIRAVEPIVLHNFHHFYGEFKHIITQELLTNTKTLFKDLGYDDSHINYNNLYHVLTH